MNLLRRTTGAMTALVALVGLVASCGSGQDEAFQTNTTAQDTIRGGEAAVLSLLGNTLSVSFPANTFTRDTVTLISTELGPPLANADNSQYLQYYPTATKAVSDLISGLVINTPVDRVFKRDITVKFAFFDETARTPGQQFLLYRFDFDNLVWNRMGNLAATVDGGGRTATVVLPTTDYRGFLGTIALFKDLRSDNQPAYTASTISGTVVGATGDPIATDVGLYYYVGTVQYPVSLANGSGARIPTGGSYRNTVDSNAGGAFTMTVPDILVGTQLNLEFGREDANRQAQQEFDILAPVSPHTDPRNLDRVRVLTVRYGVNNIRTRNVNDGGQTEPPVTVEAEDA